MGIRYLSMAPDRSLAHFKQSLLEVGIHCHTRR